MKSKMQLDGGEKVTIEAANRNNEDRTIRDMAFIVKHETRGEPSDLAAAIKQDLHALLRFYPDTRKGKRDDPQKSLAGMEDKSDEADAPPAK